MHRRLVLTAVTVLVGTSVLAPAAADAQRVVVRKGSTTTTRTTQPPRRSSPPRRVTTRVVSTQPRRWEPMASRQLTLSVGALRYAPDGDDNHPMAALRADWRLRRWLRSEFGVSYALASLDVPVVPGAVEEEEINASLATATVGLLAEAPIPYVRPYVGVAAGLFARFEEDGEAYEGESFVRPTMAIPVGVRIAVSPRLGIRAEARFRFDEHRDGRSRGNVEQTVGLSFGF